MIDRLSVKGGQCLNLKSEWEISKEPSQQTKARPPATQLKEEEITQDEQRVSDTTKMKESVDTLIRVLTGNLLTRGGESSTGRT